MTRREFLQGSVAAAAAGGTVVAAPDASKTRSYNPDMEYRPLGRTGLMISAVSMGGHWKRLPYKQGSDDFKKNRRAVINACLEHGINYIDAGWSGEVETYAEAIKGRREEIYFGFDWTEARDPSTAGSLEKLKAGFDEGLIRNHLDYVDLWRLTLREQTTRNTPHEIETVMEVLEWGKKTGRARCTGISTHHRPWIAEAVAKYPQIEVVITPYSAGSKQRPVGSMFDALRANDVGFIGIKPFASGSIFASRGEPDSSTGREDDDRARMALRYILCCEQLDTALPGLVTVDQVHNAARAVRERRQLDVAEAQRHEELVHAMWQNLPANYQWLRAWEWV